MKFLALIYALLMAFPLSLLLQASPAFTRIFWVAIGALPFLAPVLPVFDMGLITWADTWIGYVYGLEVTILDIALLAALFAVRGRGLPWVYTLPFLVFIVALALSMTQADEPTAAFFGVWQHLRMLLVMVVVARACREDPDVATRILLGMAIGITLHFLASVEQRFLSGATQARGLFVHQNTLGLITHMVLVPHLAMLLYGPSAYSSTLRNLVAVGAATMAAVLTASRGTIGMTAIGIAAVYLVLALSNLTFRKVAMAGLAFVVLLSAAPLVYSIFQARFAEAPLTEHLYDERAAFEATARAIVADHPFGIGTNHYVHIARDADYAYRSGVAEGSRDNIVHHAFWLTAAEAGWFGMATFTVMLIVPMCVALVNGWRTRHTLGGHLLLGLGTALIPVYLQSLYEWVLYAREVQYILFMIMGMIFGLALCAKARRSSRPLAPAGGTADAPPAFAPPAAPGSASRGAL